MLVPKKQEGMNQQRQIDYTRIAQAIAYINENFKEQPNLGNIAAAVNLSPFHFQRLFSDWVGVSPKKFMQFTSIKYAKGLLHEQHATLLDTAYETGFSGTSRLHDLFISIEGMTPGEFKNGGANLEINYAFSGSPFGKVIVASTAKGVCFIAFEEDEAMALVELKLRFPNAVYSQQVDKFQKDALKVFQQDWSQLERVKLHLRGTPFQMKVWESLLQIPSGQLKSYGQIAESIDQPQASRAVGSAIGKNPVAFLIPCHRVIQASGNIGGYRWGCTRKSAIIGWEAAQKERE